MSKFPYNVRSNNQVYVYQTLKEAVDRTIKLEQSGLRVWSILNVSTNAYIYKDGTGIVKPLTTSDEYINSVNTGYTLDMNLLSSYNVIRTEILTFDQGDKVEHIHYQNNAQLQKIMNIEDEKDFTFFILGRDNKIHCCKKLSDFMAWHRNRSPNRTKRGIRLFYGKKKNANNSVLISTSFMGAIPTVELDLPSKGEKFPPLFETLVIVPEINTFHIWRYSSFKDAEEGHKALSSCTPEQIIAQIEIEQTETQEAIAYVR